MKTYSGLITNLKPHQIAVFGSNNLGIHGGGAAMYAHKFWGAKMGQGEGLQGQSYGIVTVNWEEKNRPNVPKVYIIEQIVRLYKFAVENPDKEFLIIYSGKKGNVNLSGFLNEELALMFYNGGIIPSNVTFEKEFYNIIKSF